LQHLQQDGVRLAVELQPGQGHGQHWQRQQADRQKQQCGRDETKQRRGRRMGQKLAAHEFLKEGFFAVAGSAQTRVRHGAAIPFPNHS
jgi:hypothetical protein